MAYLRREFLKTTAGLTIGGLASSIAGISHLSAQTQGRRRIAVFWQEEFESNAEIALKKIDIEHAVKEFSVSFLSASELSAHLTKEAFDLLIMPFGSNFPADAYSSILQFLTRGGHLLNIGGTPFAVPWSVPTGANGKISAGVRQVNYHKDLGITQSFNTSILKKSAVIRNESILRTDELLSAIQCSSVHEMYYRFADTNDFPDESGTTGTLDAVLTPLMWIIDEQGEKRGAPIIQLDHLRGTFAGGRWILASYTGTLKNNGIALLARQALLGTLQLSATPGFASYYRGELPQITAQFRAPGGDATALLRGDCSIAVFDSKKKKIISLKSGFTGEGEMLSFTARLTAKLAAELSPGFYHVLVSQDIRSSDSSSVMMEQNTGFWIYDEELLKNGNTFIVDGNYFLSDGKPYPVAGTTYMSGDIHRKFLFQPNPFVWQEDFAQMKRSGINLVRTGIWTAWRNYMLDPGQLNEQAMRSLDAFMFTARSFNIPVIFTFFAFLPEMWNGQNAYLDPRSLSAQKEFIALIVRRYSSMNDVMWDLINEPSFCSPQNLWNCRPNYDLFEKNAWKWFLENKYPAENESLRNAMLRGKYRLTPNESLGLPAMGDFSSTTILYDKRPLKTVDYRLFAQEMFKQWTKTMAETIRMNGNPKQLITVGQDEAGTGDSPSPHFFAGEIDFTSIHNWWQNDDLVWDSVMTKVNGKANLIEETGVMFYEKMDGNAWRTEEDAANLLDRKIAISLGTGGAGFIEWIWNINPLMKNDNEATIGLIRADGTVKPEFDIVKKYAAFLNEHRNLFTEKTPEETVMLIPHSQIFSPRNSATEATKKAVRTLTYGLGIPLRAVSEYGDPTALAGAKLIIVPSPRTLSDHGWKMLTNAAQNGATVMISGIIDENEFYEDQRRTGIFSVTSSPSVIAQDETLYIKDRPVHFTFHGDKIQQLVKATLAEKTKQELQITTLGKGTIIWSPIPVENSDSEENIREYYSFGLQQAQVTPAFSTKEQHIGILILPIVFKNSVLYTIVSESNENTIVKLEHTSTTPVHTISVPAQKAVMFFVDRTKGTMIGKTMDA